LLSILPSAVTSCAERCDRSFTLIPPFLAVCCLSPPSQSRQARDDYMYILHASRPSARWSDSLSRHALAWKRGKYSSDTMPTCIHREREGERKPREHPATGTGALVSPAKACMWRPCWSRLRVDANLLVPPIANEQSWANKSAVLAMLPLKDDAPPSFSALSPALGALCLLVTTASINQP
jgi:hypothetical protein